MTAPNTGLDSYIAHEAQVAERYRWWGLYLMREKRRLSGIAEAVQAEAAVAQLNGTEDHRTPEDETREARLRGRAYLLGEQVQSMEGDD